MRKDLIVDREGDGRILRIWLTKKLPDVPSKGIRRAIQRGQITVDGKRASSNQLLKSGQSVLVHIQDKFNRNTDLTGIEILYEDEDIAAIFKPEGIEIHGGHGQGLAGSVKKLFKPSNAPDHILNPVVLHRLDKPTCGVLLFAKSKRALKSISEQFQEHTLQKQYLAVVYGLIHKEMKVNSPVDGKHAITRAIADTRRSHSIIDNTTVLNVFPTTGRKHQIRKHLASRGMPIVGDRKYGKPDDRHAHLLLCAETIAFVHPNGEQVRIGCQVPGYFGIEVDT